MVKFSLAVDVKKKKKEKSVLDSHEKKDNELLWMRVTWAFARYVFAAVCLCFEQSVVQQKVL